MRKIALFFFASSSNIGLTSHLARQIVDMYNYGKIVGIDTYCVSDIREQNSGLWSYVEERIPQKYIIKFDDFNRQDLSSTFRELLGRYDFSIIHFQGFNLLRELKGLICGNVKSVITINSFPVKPFFKKYLIGCGYYMYANKFVDKLIFLSPFALRRFVGSRNLMNKGKIVHIPFCLPNDDSSDNFELSSNAFNVVYLANFLENKGHERFFPSIAKFAKIHKDVHFWLFGDGPRRNAVLKLIADNKIGDRVHCPGRVDRRKVPSILCQSQVAMILSRHETGGHAFIEPIMHGCPVVGTRVGYAEYLIQDYVTSFGIDTVDSLFLALEYAYNHPKETKDKAERMKRIIGSIYDYEAMIRAYYELYNSLFEDRIKE